MKENRDVHRLSQRWKGWTRSLQRHSSMPRCHNISQVNIVVYLGGEGRLTSNLKDYQRRQKEVTPCSSPLKLYPISQGRRRRFEVKKATWKTHNSGARTYGIFIRFHKQFLFSWVGQWVSDKWYLSSFIRCLRIHGVCRIGKNKSIFKRLKTLDKALFLSLPLFPLLASLAIWGNHSSSGIPAHSQWQGSFCLSKPRYNRASPCRGVTYQWFSFISFVNVRGRTALSEGLEWKNGCEREQTVKTIWGRCDERTGIQWSTEEEKERFWE